MPVTISLDEYKRLKSKVEDLKAKAARAEGAYDESMRRLKEMGHDSIDGAKAALVELKGREVEAEAEYGKALAAFEAKWGDRLK